jgi:hypothetical protein
MVDRKDTTMSKTHRYLPVLEFSKSALFNLVKPLQKKEPQITPRLFSYYTSKTILIRSNSLSFHEIHKGLIHYAVTARSRIIAREIPITNVVWTRSM